MQDLGDLLGKLRRLRNNPEGNKIQVGLINSGLRDLKEEIEYMGEQKKKKKKKKKNKKKKKKKKLKTQMK